MLTLLVSFTSCRRYFADLAIEVQRLEQVGVNVRIRGAIHGRYNSYILAFQGASTGSPAPGSRTTIANNIDFPALTISFSQGRQENTGWDTRWSYEPDWISGIGEELVTTKDGNNWIHERNVDYNTWYGVSYPSTVTTVFGRSNYYDSRKVALSIEELASVVWLVESMNVYEGDQIVQNTNMAYEEQWRTIERDHYAAIPRNTLTPNVQYPIVDGDSMRAHSFDVKFTISTNQLALLEKVYFKYILSQRSIR